MKKLRFRWPWKKSSRKKNPSSYHLLLHEKKNRVKKHEFAHTPKTPLSFVWQKYKSSVVGILLGIFVFGGLGGIFFFSGFFSIQEIALTRQDLRVNVEAISTVLQGIRGRNILLLSKAQLTTALQKRFPEIETVTIEKIYPNTLQIFVSTFPIVAQWQFLVSEKSEDITISEVAGDEFLEEIMVFIDSQGRVSEVQEGENKPEFLFEETVEPFDFPEIHFGYEVLSGARLADIFAAKELLEKKINASIQKATYFRQAQEIHFQTETGTFFWLDFFTAFAEQLEKIDIALGELPLFEKELEYVDLRIPGRLLYKEK